MAFHLAEFQSGIWESWRGVSQTHPVSETSCAAGRKARMSRQPGSVNYTKPGRDLVRLQLIDHRLFNILCKSFDLPKDIRSAGFSGSSNLRYHGFAAGTHDIHGSRTQRHSNIPSRRFSCRHARPIRRVMSTFRLRHDPGTWSMLLACRGFRRSTLA